MQSLQQRYDTLVIQQAVLDGCIRGPAERMAAETLGKLPLAPRKRKWDKLCVTEEIANTWADNFLIMVERIWSESTGSYFAGTPNA